MKPSRSPVSGIGSLPSVSPTPCFFNCFPAASVRSPSCSSLDQQLAQQNGGRYQGPQVGRFHTHAAPCAHLSLSLYLILRSWFSKRLGGQHTELASICFNFSWPSLGLSDQSRLASTSTHDAVRTFPNITLTRQPPLALLSILSVYHGQPCVDECR
ncbi:hypothetical protein BDY21DRAFT_79525 [Lineolata rhizophorae]|uniref:Uncharacterized protein n=1 Tax=Lineolata rhizophorae TaxID=578093 RepID=A0A6A6NTN7_9PEZI|nr:hypothetical protein BDY21DRAFT_79525 [Lineolata rhizophorae]